MGDNIIHNCQCHNCQQEEDHADKILHHQINLFLSRLDEQQSRWYVALEAKRIGHGGIKLLSEITGMDKKTISRGLEEIDKDLSIRPVDRIRQEGGGRKQVEKKGTSD